MSHPYQRRRPFSIGFALLVLVAIVVRYAIRSSDTPTPNAPSGTSTQSEISAERPQELVREGIYQVERVVDGDTLLMSNQWRIRLLGVDTPETVKPEHPVEPWGPEASAFTKEFVSGGEVRLRFDREREDKYGRILAYVFVGDRMLNEELILAGLSPAKTYFNYSPAFKKRFVAAEEKAQAAGRGIWSEKRN